ncbi:MAG TPA: hypothetical protein VK859_12910, partial [bacterium]|nr:hypothetical protein [bacterium]
PGVGASQGKYRYYGANQAKGQNGQAFHNHLSRSRPAIRNYLTYSRKVQGSGEEKTPPVWFRLTIQLSANESLPGNYKR